LVIETHFHADFLSGHLELAEATGAKIVYSSVAKPEFDFIPVEDGQRYSLGDVWLEFRHTPGHTPESMSVVVYEHADDTVPYGVMTGDTLFIGDVGRPDLLGSIGFTKEELADKLYESLHTKLMTLPDSTKVYPAHGAGSACGKNLSTELWSTMGEQRKTNYALRASSKEKFVELVTEGQPPAPGYFVYNAILNQKGRELLDETEMPAAMTYDEVREAMQAGAILVDGRDPEEFALGHLKGAVNIGLEGRYAEFAGSVVKPEDNIILFTDPERVLEGKNRLGRIGFDRVIGYLSDPYAVMFDRRDDVAVASRLTTNALGERIADVPELQLVDVRNPGETAAGMIARAVNIPVGQLPDRVGELDPRKPTVVYCAGGYRSSVAASLLRQRGFADVSDLLGGYNAWEAATQNA
jgi:rhodanese-related sulfurtransferase/glyoxylase-like metal-dependent hydrolase (beta-lactamase superfamily II)